MRPPSNPIDPRTARGDRERLNERRLNLNVQCRETRTPSPVRTPVHATDYRQRLIEREDHRGQTWVIGRAVDAVVEPLPSSPRTPAPLCMRTSTSVRPTPTDTARISSAARPEGATSAPSSNDPRSASRTPRANRESFGAPPDAAGPENWPHAAKAGGIHVAHTKTSKIKTNSSELAENVHGEANALDVKPSDEQHLVECGAWIVSDQSGLRQRLLQLNSFGPVFAIFNDLQSKGKYDQLANQIAASKPKLLWVRLAGPACGSGNRRDDRRASFLVRLLLQQVSCSRLDLQSWKVMYAQKVGI